MQYVRNFSYSRESLQFISIIAFILYTSIAPFTLLLFQLQISWNLLLLLPLVLLVIVIHESLHLLPLHYYKVTTNISVTWSFLLPKISVTYTGTLSRNQLLLINLFPFTVISGLTTFFGYLMYQLQWIVPAKLLIYVFVLNTIGSLQDIYMSYLFLQLPSQYHFVVKEDSVEIWR